MNIIYFIVGMLLPYFAEQTAYRRLILPVDHSPVDRTISQSYGWRIVWDAAFFFVLLYSAWRMISSSASLSSMEWAGYLVFVSGVALRIWALSALLHFYDAGIAIRADHELIRSGPYQILRHPLHMGTLFKITGLSLFCPLWLAVPAILGSFLLALILNRREDRTHFLEFGPAFGEYYRSTWDIADVFFWKSRHE